MTGNSIHSSLSFPSRVPFGFGRWARRCAAAAVGLAAADGGAADPVSIRRELSPDRPDATESPITVDAGVFVIEASVIDWRRDGGDDVFTAMSTNAKVGLTDDTDLQIVFDSYIWEQPEADDGGEGFGDVQIRLKHNVWGNDGGDSGFAIFPFVKIPTGTDVSNGEWEGGLILPYATELTHGIGLGLMAEIDVVYDEDDAEHDIEFLHSAVLGFDLADRVGMFTEYVGVAGESTYEAYFAGGFTFSVSEDFILDCGVQIGLNDDAEDLGVFAGFTKRF